jgi:hypothetical protein
LVQFLSGQPFCYHSKTGQYVRVFEWSPSLDRFINKRVINFSLTKRSRLVETSNSGPIFEQFENRTKIVSEKLLFENQIVRISNGHCNPVNGGFR